MSLGVDCTKLSLGVSRITCSYVQFLTFYYFSLKYFSSGSIYMFTTEECPVNLTVSPNY